MGRVTGDDDESWADGHEGDMMQGSIHQLKEQNPPGKPCPPDRGPLGFCVDPAEYKPKRRRRCARKS